jgi:predicted RNase H-like HicB family nuclease
MTISDFGMELQFIVFVQWSEDDQCFLASLPEVGPYAQTHGQTYEEALENAKEAMALLLEDASSFPMTTGNQPEKLANFSENH